MRFHIHPVAARSTRASIQKLIMVGTALSACTMCGAVSSPDDAFAAAKPASWHLTFRPAQPEPKPVPKPIAKKGVLAVPNGITVTRDVEYAAVNGRKLLLDIYLPEKAKPEEPKPQEPKPGEPKQDPAPKPAPPAHDDAKNKPPATLTTGSHESTPTPGAGHTPPTDQHVAEPSLPVVIWIHGGGWESGTKDASPAARLVPFGYAAVSISYRFSQVAPYPAQIYDCKAAVRWVRAHAKEYNFDPDHIGVWGASAGGHLVALLGTSGGEKELEGDVGDNLDQSSAVQAVCDWFGPTDFIKLCRMAAGENAEEAALPRSDLIVPQRKAIEKADATSHALPPADAGDAKPATRNRPKIMTPGVIRKLFGGAIQNKLELAVLANPITFIDKSDAPVLIMHGDIDSLVPLDQSTLFKIALEAAGVKVKLHVVKGGGHGFWNDELLGMVRSFFDENLKPKAADKSGDAAKPEKPVAR